MKKRIILASTVALSFAPVLATQAEELVWTARSVEQIQNDVTKSENKTSYTIQYGDTLSTIAEALGVDVTVLANLNKISNIDLIFPDGRRSRTAPRLHRKQRPAGTKHRRLSMER